MDRILVEALLSPAHIVRSEEVQSLWAGYGEIVRVHLDDGRSVVVKVVEQPAHAGDDVSSARKVKSYQIERDFYKEVVVKECRVPRLVAARGNCLVLEDLDAAGYRGRKWSAKRVREVEPMVKWLACFHREFMGYENSHLWEQGCYWNLATRPDELRALRMSDPLRRYADEMDGRLRAAKHTTLIHGDAKIANFCFSADDQVAVVDFQYVGRGVGVRDLAYLLGSCLDENRMEQFADGLLDYYFQQLRRPEVENEWRQLWPICFADFERFYKGWAGTSTTRENRNGYTRRQVNKALDQLSKTT